MGMGKWIGNSLHGLGSLESRSLQRVRRPSLALVQRARTQLPDISSPHHIFTMGFFRTDAEQPSPIASESGTSSPTEKFGDEKVANVVTPTRIVGEAEEQRLIRKLDRRIVPMMVSLNETTLCHDQHTFSPMLTSILVTGVDVLDEFHGQSLHW
jgi:hypothetical protein